MDEIETGLRPTQFVGGLFKILGWTMVISALISLAFVMLTNTIEYNYYIVLLSGIPALVLLGVGKALTDQYPRGHSAGVVVGILMLLYVPLGSLLGLLALWCLLKSDELRPVNHYLHVFLAGLSFVSAVAIIAIAHYAVPKFSKMFEGFGAELPFFTQLALDNYGVVLMLPLLVLGVFLFWRQQETRTLAVVTVGLSGSILILQLLVIALYFPVFRMGAVVQ